MGHARALISVDDPELQLAFYERVLIDGLSVRNVEELVRNNADKPVNPKAPKEKQAKLPEEYNVLKEHLSRFFRTDVELTYNKKGKGKITIPFHSEEELEKVIGLLDKMK